MRFDIPVDIGRDAARQLAERELLNPVYAEAKPPWWQRVSAWAWERLGDLFTYAWVGFSGLLVIIVLGALLALIAFVIVRRTGGVQRRRSTRREVFTDQSLTAADHRARAERAASSGDWGEAVRESFRAVVRQLEERGAIDPRPGRTADEAARDGGVVFGAQRVELSAAARLFDEVAYGDHPGTAPGYQQITALDRTLRRSTMVGV